MIPHSKPLITPSDIDSVARQMASGMLANGGATRDFEGGLLELTGGVAAVATTSGTAAQVLCLKALDIGPGDEVVLPTYVCESVGRAIRSVGAEPVYCDFGETWNATRETILQKMTPRTKAVILVNIFGIENDATDLGVPVVEDHCQSLGLSKLKSVAGFCSFHATKCMTTGEGGAAVFNNASLADKIRFGAPLLSDIQAALGLSQLGCYGSMLKRREEIAARYFAKMPSDLTGRLRPLNSIYYRFPLVVHGEFDGIQDAFKQRGVAARRGVDFLGHRFAGLSDEDFPNATRLFNETVSVPLYPALDESEIDRIIEAVNDIAPAIVR